MSVPIFYLCMYMSKRKTRVNLWNFYSHRFEKEPKFSLHAYNILQLKYAVMLVPELLSSILPPIQNVNLRQLKMIKSNDQSCERLLNTIKLTLKLFGVSFGDPHKQTCETQRQGIYAVQPHESAKNNRAEQKFYVPCNDYKIFMQRCRSTSENGVFYLKLLNNIFMYLVVLGFSDLSNDVKLLLEYAASERSNANSPNEKSMRSYVEFLPIVQRKFAGLAEDEAPLEQGRAEDPKKSAGLSLAAKFVLSVNLMSMLLGPAKSALPRVVFPSASGWHADAPLKYTAPQRGMIVRGY